MKEKFKWIPNDILKRLNEKAHKAGGKSMTEDCPILTGGHNAPIFRALPGIEKAGWYECVLPATPDCLSHVLLSVSESDYAALPEREVEL